MLRPKVIQHKVGALGKELAVLQKRSDVMLMARNQAVVGMFVHARPLELHPIALGEALNLSVAEHRQAGQRCEQCADAEILVSSPELVDGGALVGIAHEVDVSLQDVWIELNCL